MVLKKQDSKKRRLWFAFLISGGLMVVLSGCATSRHYLTTANQWVTLFLKAPKAQSVVFSSSLDGFEHHPARRGKSGIWEITVIGQNEFTYFYLVDGKMVHIPCLPKEKDDFGSKNCIFIPQNKKMIDPVTRL